MFAAIRRWWRRRAYKRERAAMRARAPRHGGSLIIAVGPARSGKTHAIALLAIAASLRYGLPLYVQDPTATFQVRVDSTIAWLESLGTEKAKRAVEHLRTHVVYFRGRNTDEMLRVLSDIVGDGSKPAEDWQGVVVFDDAGVLRQANPQFFDEIVPLFGNAGLLGFATEQRDKGLPPAARVNVRAELAWALPGRNVINDVEIPRESLTQPRTDNIRYVDNLTGEWSTWNINEPPPEFLTVPAPLTEMKPQPVYWSVDHGEA